MNNILKRNWVMKLTAVLLAVLLWMYVTYQNPENEQLMSQVNLSIKGLPTSYEVSGIPKTVDIQVQGALPFSGEVPYREVTAWVDLSEIRMGRNMVDVQVKVPFGVHLISVIPDRVSVNIAKKGGQ